MLASDTIPKSPSRIPYLINTKMARYIENQLIFVLYRNVIVKILSYGEKTEWDE